MAGEPEITITGNITDDPELRFTQQGVAVARFTVAVNKRVKEGDKWVDGKTNYYRCTVWREFAENVTESLTKGTRVVVHGKFDPSEYTTKEGEKRTSLDITVDEVGPSLKYAKATVQRMARTSGGSTTATDSWASTTSTGQGAPNDPPF